MKKFFSMVCACLLALSAQATDIKKYDALYENLPFQMEKVTRPQFPANEVNLKDFGAIGDGSSLCTTAFAKAIDALTQKGGGKLIVPQGVWFTGPIVLKSNINLHLEKGAVILFSPDDALYPLRALKKVPNFKLHSLFLNFNSCPRSISSFKSEILFWTGI